MICMWWGGGRLETIDFMKGIAMLMVILVHSIQRFNNLFTIFNLFKLGQLGCQLFFFCSGFLLMKTYKEEKFRWFLWKRYSALIPGYYLMIIILTILRFSVGEYRSLLQILFNVLLLQGLLPFCNNNIVNGGWYIGTTIVFYWIFPIVWHMLIKYKDSKLLKFIPCIFAVISWIIGIFLYVLGIRDVLNNNGFYYFNFITQFPCFLYGCIYSIQDNRINAKNNLFIGLILLLVCFFSYAIGSIGYKLFFIMMPFIFTSGIYFVIQNLDVNKTIRKNMFNEILMLLGRYSFYIFLAHPFFVWYMPEIVLQIMGKLRFCINSTLLYILLLPFMLIGSIILGGVLNRICMPMCMRLRRVFCV